MEDTQLIIRRCKRSNDKKLDLKGKNIVNIPNELFQLAYLEELDLSNNKIQNIDARIGDLKSLRVLYLSNNQIRQLPQSIMNLKLDKMIIDNNPLQKNFEILLQKENMAYQGLEDSLKQIFNIKQESYQSGQQDQPALDNQMINKVKELEDQLSKMKMTQQQQQQQQQIITNRSNSSQYNNLLKIDNYLLKTLEIDSNYLQSKEVISQGGFSIVYKGIYKGCEVAIKQIFDPNITDELLEQVGNEITNLSYFRHPHIVQIMGIVSIPQKLSIITEYMPQSLFQVIHKFQVNMKEEQKLFIVKQLAKAILYIHLSGYVHRDIKTHNILLDHNFNLKLCDFGLTSPIDQTNKGLNQFWGTPTYMAPELFQKKPYDHKIDMFAFGNVLYEIYEKHLPFDGFEVQDLMVKVLKGEVLTYKYSSKQIQTIIDSCRLVDASNRPDMLSVLSKLNNMIL